MTTNEKAKSEGKGLGFFERYLTVWVLLPRLNWPRAAGTAAQRNAIEEIESGLEGSGQI